MSFFPYKDVVVVGFSESAKGAVGLLASAGIRPRVSSISHPAKEDEGLLRYIKDAEFGRNSEGFAEGADLVVTSPGVKDACPVILRARSRGIPVIDEIELAYRFCPVKIIAITGTNGKSTCVYYMYNILKEAGLRVSAGGNFGTAFSRLLKDAGSLDWIVLEVSSFQLSRIERFRPYIAGILNISPDHIDWHGSFERYIDAKLNIFKNQKEADFALLNSNDAITFQRTVKIASKRLLFNEDRPGGLDDNKAFALSCAQILGIDRDFTLRVLKGLKGLEHRLEFAGTFLNKRFYNDSKATNISSCLFALKSLRREVSVICGGISKGQDFSRLKQEPDFLRWVKKVFCFGESAFQIESALSGSIPVIRTRSLREAVELAVASLPEDVLFSPMCSSFDMFSNYQERGKRFKDIINSFK